MEERLKDLKDLEDKISQLYIKNLDTILRHFGKKKGLKKKQLCIDEILKSLKELLDTNDLEKFDEARKVILIEFAHFCEKKGICHPTFESPNNVFNIPPAFKYIEKLTDIQMLYLSSKQNFKFTLSHEQLNSIRQNNSSYHVLTLLSEWKKGDAIGNLPLETLSNESNVTINKQQVDLPNKKSSNLQKVFDITPYCNEYKNEMIISSLASSNYGKTYLIVVAFCTTKTYEQFLQTLTEIPIDEIKGKMFKKQTENDDDDIISTSNALSLQCPVSLTRIHTPTKFKSCMHLNCVDASSMYQMYSHFSIWHCPVCNKKCNYKDLIIDGYIKNIINTIPNYISSVTISPEGEYTYQHGQETEIESDNEESDKKIKT